jgi:hypothetical protein
VIRAAAAAAAPATAAAAAASRVMLSMPPKKVACPCTKDLGSGWVRRCGPVYKKPDVGPRWWVGEADLDLDARPAYIILPSRLRRPRHLSELLRAKHKTQSYLTRHA